MADLTVDNSVEELRLSGPPAEPQRVILVLGMHRSGTSATAGVLARLGATPPTDLMEAGLSNERGHWESQAFRQFHDDLLRSAGSSWDDWRPIGRSWYTSPGVKTARKAAAELFSSKFGDSRLTIFKDPRICRFVPFWLDVISEMRAEAHVVIPVRSPLEVAESLRRRDESPISKGLLLWLRHVLDAEAATRHVSRSVVLWKDFQSSWRIMVDKISSDIGIQWPCLTDQVCAEIDEFLSLSLIHHRVDDSVLAVHPDVNDWLSGTYAAMTQLAQGREPELNYAVLDEITAQFNNASRLFGREFGAVELKLKTSIESTESLRGQCQQLSSAIRLREEETIALGASQATVMTELSAGLLARDTRIAELERERDTRTTELERERDTRIAELEKERDTRIAELENEIAVLGETVVEAERHREISGADLAAMAQARDERVASHEDDVANLRALAIDFEHRYEMLNKEIGERIRDESNAAANLQAGHASEVAELSDRLSERDDRIVGLEHQARLSLEQMRELEKQICKAADESAEQARRTEQNEATMVKWREALIQARYDLNWSEQHLRVISLEHQTLLASTAWRATRTLISVVGRLPPNLRLWLRRVLKLAFWTVTPWRMPARRRFLQDRRRTSAPTTIVTSLAPRPVDVVPSLMFESRLTPAAVEVALPEASNPPEPRSLWVDNPVDSVGGEVWRDVVPQQLKPTDAATSATAHQDLSGPAAEIAASPLFDDAWYCARYPDVAASGLAPAEHYVRCGVTDNLDPSPYFSTGAYLELNPDVARAEMNPLLHLLRHGVYERRPFQPSEHEPVLKADQKLRIVYVCGEPDSPGKEYRVLRYCAAAITSGTASAVWINANNIAARISEFKTADLLVIWRAPWRPPIADAIAIMRARGKPVVFDVDDLMTEPDIATTDIIDGIRTQNITEEGTRNYFRLVRLTMQAADFCFATTDELAYHLRNTGHPTFTLPNGFDQRTLGTARQAIRRRRLEPADALVRIGYAGGSRTHQRDLAMAVEAVAKVLRERPNCRLVMFKDAVNPMIDVSEYPAMAGLDGQIEWRSFRPIHELPEELARFDINIAPLEFGNPFCEAKSELKVFEAAIADVPTIASPTGSIGRAIEHGKTGFLAATADEWYAHLLTLVDDQALRANIGRQAYHSALARYGPLNRTELISRVLPQLTVNKGIGAQINAAHAWAFDAHLKKSTAPLPQVFPSSLVFENDNGRQSAITVVIPLYNYEMYIEEALRSVFNQTISDLDLVIVDGLSTDNSLKVALKWVKSHQKRFNRIILIQNNNNYGLGLCRNSGFDIAETPYILLLDADNRLKPECCSDLLQTAEQESAAYVYGTIQQFGTTTSLMSHLPYHPQRFVGGNFIDAMALVSKEAWAMVGGFHHIRFGWEDYDFWVRLAERGLRGAQDPRVVAEYRTHKASMRFTQTTIPANSRALWKNFAQLHPWVRLVEEIAGRHSRGPRERLSSTSIERQVTRLLPILRCPETKQKLTFSADGEALVTVDGARIWPLHNGRPLLVSGMAAPDVRPLSHFSNQLSPEARRIIEETPGLVLYLSAGGTTEKPDNVVEAEYALFRNTDVLADAHDLPFDDESFEAVLALNAFEHYREPELVAAELYRVLKPGGRILILTAFMQPVHEKPWHFYGATRHGVEQWFKAFDCDGVRVSPNFCPNHSLGWMISDLETGLRHNVSAGSAEAFNATTIGEFVEFWRDPSRRAGPVWRSFERLPQDVQEGTAAGFEFVGHRPLHLPKL